MPVKWKIYYACNVYLLLWSIYITSLFLFRVSWQQGGLKAWWQMAFICFGAFVFSVVKSGYSLFLIARLKRSTYFTSPAFPTMQAFSLVLFVFIAALVYISIPGFLFISIERDFRYLVEISSLALAPVCTIYIIVMDFKIPVTLQNPDINIELIGKKLFDETANNEPMKWKMHHLSSLFVLLWSIMIIFLFGLFFVVNYFVETPAILVAVVITGVLFLACKAILSIKLYTYFKNGHPISSKWQTLFYIFHGVHLMVVAGMVYLMVSSVVARLLSLNEEYIVVWFDIAFVFITAASLYLCISDIALMKVILRRYNNNSMRKAGY